MTSLFSVYPKQNEWLHELNDMERQWHANEYRPPNSAEPSPHAMSHMRKLLRRLWQPEYWGESSKACSTSAFTWNTYISEDSALETINVNGVSDVKAGNVKFNWGDMYRFVSPDAQMHLQVNDLGEFKFTHFWDMECQQTGRIDTNGGVWHETYSIFGSGGKLIRILGEIDERIQEFYRSYNGISDREFYEYFAECDDIEWLDVKSTFFVIG